MMKFKDFRNRQFEISRRLKIMAYYLYGCIVYKMEWKKSLNENFHIVQISTFKTIRPLASQIGKMNIACENADW